MLLAWQNRTVLTYFKDRHPRKKFKIWQIGGLYFSKQPIYIFPGTSTWNDNFIQSDGTGFCDGTSQSPIDIPYNGVAIKRDWLPFQLINYDIDPYKMYIENNGHGAKITFDPRNCNYMPTVIQGGLPGKT